MPATIDMASLDQAVIDDLRSLDPDGSGGVLADVLETYLEDAAKRLLDLESAQKSGDAEHLKGTAHALKGASRSVGATAVAGLCAKLENDEPNPEEDLALLRAELDRAFAEIRALLD